MPKIEDSLAERSGFEPRSHKGSRDRAIAARLCRPGSVHRLGAPGSDLDLDPSPVQTVVDNWYIVRPGGSGLHSGTSAATSGEYAVGRQSIKLLSKRGIA
jgi:hypothetical protein